MKQPLLITLESGEQIIINEEQITTVRQGMVLSWNVQAEQDVRISREKSALVKTSDGDELIVVDPPYNQWLNDVFKKNE